MSRPFDARIHCGAKKRAGDQCRQHRGARTDHPGVGRCWLHGGRSPNGRKFAEKEAAKNALERLGIPVGTGDPFTLLTEAIRHAEGQLLASALLLQEVATKQRDGVTLEAAIAIHVRDIREAARTAKAAVEADVAERLAVVDERLAEIIHRVLSAGLDAAGVSGDARAKAEAAVVRELVAVGPSRDGLN